LYWGLNRASHLVGRYSTTWAIPSTPFIPFI
jgi:hypothetical protein